MGIGVSTACLYPMVTEDSMKTLLGLGFRTFEIFFNTRSELSPSFLRALKQQTDACGAQVRSVHPFYSGYESFLLFSDYERRFADTLEEYKQCFEAAALFGAAFVVIHGDRRMAIEEERYFERFSAVARCAAGFGVTAVQENVYLHRSAEPAFILRMKAALGSEARFVLDIKQAIRAGVSPYVMCDAMGENLLHVHINDNRPGEDCLLPGQGRMDYGKLRRQLDAVAFHGDFIIEVYRGNFKEPEELAASRVFLEKTLGGAE